MILIATDEAGYGPKLGPLVIAATTWTLPPKAVNEDDLSSFFGGMKETQTIDGCKIVVDDSKAIYQPASSKSSASSKPSARADRLFGLHAIVSAANHWSDTGATDLAGWIRDCANQDCQAIDSTPWLANIPDVDFLKADQVAPVVSAWSSSGVQLRDARARIIAASQFNQICERGYNKADILSESTLKLVRNALQDHADESAVRVFCDRHGGRRYYAGVLQHIFDGVCVSVVEETKQLSAGRIDLGNREASIEFSVKGDRFTPVALSSIYAKYLRERMMQSFNEFFIKHHRHKSPLKPTAGYPSDANRFLADVKSTIAAERIQESDLIRQR